MQIINNGISNGLYSSDNEFEEDIYKLFNTNYDAFIGAAKACQQTIEMHKLACNRSIIDLLKILGLVMPVICVKPIMYFNSPYISKIEGHYKSPLHQDWRSMQGSMNSMIIWMPLVDIYKKLSYPTDDKSSSSNSVDCIFS